MDDERVKQSNEWLLSLSTESHELEAFTLHGLQVLQARPGFILCRFVVSNRILDECGNWEAGAIATLIDDVGATAIYSLVGHIKLSLDFSISYFSPARFQEEVEIEARVVGDKGKLSCVVIEVRRKENGELIALGKQWMASNSAAKKSMEADRCNDCKKACMNYHIKRRTIRLPDCLNECSIDGGDCSSSSPYIE